jgi:hypothetical protein
LFFNLAFDCRRCRSSFPPTHCPSTTPSLFDELPRATTDGRFTTNYTAWARDHRTTEAVTDDTRRAPLLEPIQPLGSKSDRRSETKPGRGSTYYGEVPIYLPSRVLRLFVNLPPAQQAPIYTRPVDRCPTVQTAAQSFRVQPIGPGPPFPQQSVDRKRARSRSQWLAN